ncbi:serine protease 44 [Bubalus bubalis]|uniref:serine protease 44 n=1 Tax=Bubalus bubalis TaxID=89462 RepID=UPI000DBCA31D|nr:serine protease 44 [Bubalus bubalis]XP_045019814.1 serine protease 44 [Bubalus bubalis]
MAAPGVPRCGGGSLGLLVWLLVFQPLLSEGDGSKGASTMSPTLQGAPSTSGYPTSVNVSAHPVSPVPPITPVGETLKPAQTPAFEPLPPQGTCGRRVMRIVGGVPSPERKWPWQVSLQINGVHKCGGSLIAPRWVLTSAHCVRGHEEYTVRLGDTLLQSNSQNAVVIPVQDIICYNYYNYQTMRHDIALVLLALSVNYSAYIQPVCLPGKDFEVKAGTVCWATGWGRTLQFGPSRVPTLQETEQVILHYTTCNRMVKKQEKPFPKVVRKGMVCGYHEKSGGPCKGDAGGPLVCQFNDRWIQMGIVSWGVHCALKEVPAVYTDVRFYKDWVYGTMSQASILDSGGFFIPWVCLMLALSILVTL